MQPELSQTPVPPPPAPAQPSAKSGISGTVLAVAAIGIFTAAIFISNEKWDCWPGSKKPYSS